MIILEVIIGTSIGALISAIPCIKGRIQAMNTAPENDASIQTEADESLATPITLEDAELANHEELQTDAPEEIQAPVILISNDLPSLNQYQGTCACHEVGKCPFIATYPSLYHHGVQDCALDNLDRFDIVLRALLNFDGTVQASDTHVAEAAVLGSDLDSNDEAFLYALRSLGYVEATN